MKDSLPQQALAEQISALIVQADSLLNDKEQRERAEAPGNVFFYEQWQPLNART